MSHSRSHTQTYGAEGLLDRIPGPRGPPPNRVASEDEEAILAHALAHPTQGTQRVADELMLRGVQVSSGGRQRGVEPYQVFKKGIRKPRTPKW